jgi:putative nucleotidyltransferase-like protein
MHDPAAATADPSPLALICALLRGEAPAWPEGGADGGSEGFLRAARCHGVTPLLDSKFTDDKLKEAWPQAIWQACHADTLAQAMHELALRAELERVLAALAGAGVAPLILKGTGLAYSHYPRPGLRPRGDTDLLIPPDAAAIAGDIFKGLGYSRDHGIEGAQVSQQATWSRSGDRRGDNHFDVHWRISNSPILAKALGYAELARRAQPVPALGAHARVLMPVDALLFACVHRAGHANVRYWCGDDFVVGGDRLIWLYDMHLLLIAMSPADLHEFTGLAAEKQLRTVCLDALRMTRECFSTPIAQAVFDALQPGATVEPSACYVHGGRRLQVLGDFLALDGWPARLRWLMESCFPAADYMRRKYPEATIRWLPVLYARRALDGLAKRLLPGGSGRRL